MKLDRHERRDKMVNDYNEDPKTDIAGLHDDSDDLTREEQPNANIDETTVETDVLGDGSEHIDADDTEIISDDDTTTSMDETKPTTPINVESVRTASSTNSPYVGKIDRTPVDVPMYEQNYKTTYPTEPIYSQPNAYAPQVTDDDKPRSQGWKFVMTGTVSALAAVALCFGAISSGLISVPSSGNFTTITSNTGGVGTSTGSKTGYDWSTVSKKVSASVVSIAVQDGNSVAQGSGAVLDTTGNIITNAHVVNGGSNIQVTLSNGNIYSAKLVGMDATTDLAVIKLDSAPSDLTPVTFADSDSVAVGQQIMSAGNPLGYSNSVTSGIVSAVDRPVSVSDSSGSADQGIIVTNAIQIDSAINQGNSGGPTFDANGEVIGINSSIASMSSTTDSAGSIGIGFAIPSNLAKRISNEIIKNGKVQHVKLGVTIQTATATVDGTSRVGAKIMSVSDGSPADKAGLKTGDVVVSYDGKSTDSNEALMGHVRAAAYNDEAKLSIVRDGKLLTVNVKLDKVEDTSNVQPRSGSTQQNDNDSQNRRQGDGSSDYEDFLNELFNR